MYLAFFDLSTGNLSTVYRQGDKGELLFPHSPVMQVGSFWKKSEVHQTSVDELVQGSFDNWTLGLSAWKFGSGGFELEIGTRYSRESLGGLLLTIGLSAMGTYAINAAPGNLGFALFSVPGGGRKNTMYFKSQFLQEPFSPLPYKELEDKSELIDSFADSRGISRKEISLINLAGNQNVGYYEPLDKQYLIYKF